MASATSAKEEQAAKSAQSSEALTKEIEAVKQDFAQQEKKTAHEHK